MDPSPQTTTPPASRLPVGQGFTAPRQITSSGGFRPTANRSRSMLDVLATILFIVALLGWIGFYGYSFLLKRDIETITRDIDARAQAFNPATIDSLETLGHRLSYAKKIINEHASLTPLFCFIESNTLTRNIQFSSFGYSRTGEVSGATTNGGAHAVKLLGRAGSFESLAYQANVLEGTNSLSALSFNNLFVSPLDGKVEFESAFNVNKSLLAYQPTATGDCTTASTTTNI